MPKRILLLAPLAARCPGHDAHSHTRWHGVRNLHRHHGLMLSVERRDRRRYCDGKIAVRPRRDATA